MFFDFGGGWTCSGCGKVFEWIPLETAEQFGKVPADAELLPVNDVAPAKQKKAGLYWTGAGIPKRCSRCEPSGWVVPVVPAGRSFFRR